MGYQSLKIKKQVRQAGAAVCIIVILFAVSREAGAQCEEARNWWNQREDLAAQLEELENVQPFIDQFQQVKQEIEVVAEALHETGKDLGKVKEKIDKLLGKTKEQNEEMQNVRQWARSVYSNQDWEPRAAPRGNKPLTISKGLGKAKDWISEIEKDLGKFRRIMNVLERAVEAREGRPSEQLKAFRDYFNSIREVIGKYADEVPLIGIFMKFFSFYEEAIGLIANSVESIEKEYSRRDQILRDLGPEFNNVRYHWPQTTPNERLARQKNAIRQEIANIDKRLEPLLRDCAGVIGVDRREKEGEEESSANREIVRARQAAERRCATNFNVSGESELVNKRNELLEKLQRSYPRTRFWPMEYGNSLTAAEEIDWIEKRHLNRKFTYVSLARKEYAQLQQESDSIENRFQQFRARRITLSSAQQSELNLARQDKKKALEWKKKRLAEDSLALSVIDRDLKELLDWQQKMEDFMKCEREWMEGLARQMNWDLYWLRRFNPDLYRKPFVRKFQVIDVLFPATVKSSPDKNSIRYYPVEVSWKGTVEFPLRLLWSNTFATGTGNYRPATITINDNSNPVKISSFYGFWGFRKTEEMVFELQLEEAKPGGRKTPPFQVYVKVNSY